MEKHTEIGTLGEFGLIDRLTAGFSSKHPSTIKAAGDDAAVLDTEYAHYHRSGTNNKLSRDPELENSGKGSNREQAQGGKSKEDSRGNYSLLSTDLLLEGIDFDLTYFPLKHLGYKAVVVGISDIPAMNGRPTHVMVSIGVSAKFSVEQLDELYSGIRAACEDYGLDMIGGDTSASVNGLTVSITAFGYVAKDSIAYRSGARPNDLVCITGDLGAAYMGLHLLEREKRAFAGHDAPQPEFKGYEYLLRRQLRPSARLDVVESLADEALVPTSMIDLSDGLASDLLQICKSSACGVRIYLERIPIARETYKLAEELNIDPVVAALNGGGDYELLFTVPLSEQEKIARIGGIDIIGHITSAETGAMLITPDGGEIQLKAPGFRE